MNNKPQMFSKREQRWIDAMPMPYPPTWIDWVKHGIFHWFWASCPDLCRVKKQRQYEFFEAWHRGDFV